MPSAVAGPEEQKIPAQATGGTHIKMVRAIKGVQTVMPRPPKHWVGNGFNVYPVFAHLAFTKVLSPWLMFDYASPKQFEPTKQRRGVGQHPHRGFDILTYILDGSDGFRHRDSLGGEKTYRGSSAQWMRTTQCKNQISRPVLPR